MVGMRSSHMHLDDLTSTLTPADPVTPSSLPGWSIASIPSHLGSGTEVALGIVRRGVKGRIDAPSREWMKTVWDRWNRLAPLEAATNRAKTNNHHLGEIERLRGGDDQITLQALNHNAKRRPAVRHQHGEPRGEDL
jgi:hypothetical protein